MTSDSSGKSLNDTCIVALKDADNRLLWFVFGLLLSLGTVEFLIRSNETFFKGASHRMLAKAAIFEEKAKVDFVFFGTSRTQDGVSPRLVSRRLREISPALGKMEGFNAASTGSSIEDLLLIAPRYFQKSTLHTVIIELSIAHLANQPSLPPPPHFLKAKMQKNT